MLVNGVITSVIIAVLQSVITDISLIMNIVKKVIKFNKRTNGGHESGQKFKCGMILFILSVILFQGVNVCVCVCVPGRFTFFSFQR